MISKLFIICLIFSVSFAKHNLKDDIFDGTKKLLDTISAKIDLINNSTNQDIANAIQNLYTGYQDIDRRVTQDTLNTLNMFKSSITNAEKEAAAQGLSVDQCILNLQEIKTILDNEIKLGSSAVIDTITDHLYNELPNYLKSLKKKVNELIEELRHCSSQSCAVDIATQAISVDLDVETTVNDKKDVILNQTIPDAMYDASKYLFNTVFSGLQNAEQVTNVAIACIKQVIEDKGSTTTNFPTTQDWVTTTRDWRTTNDWRTTTDNWRTTDDWRTTTDDWRTTTDWRTTPDYWTSTRWW